MWLSSAADAAKCFLTRALLLLPTLRQSRSKKENREENKGKIWRFVQLKTYLLH